MNVLKEILEEIQEGRTIFNPISQSSVEMKNFQPIAKILLFAHKEGLIEGFAEHKESETAYNLYDFVLVKGGLSYQGEKYLQNIEDENTEKITKRPPSSRRWVSITFWKNGYGFLTRYFSTPKFSSLLGSK